MKHRLPSEVESINDNSESISSVQSCVSRPSRHSIKSHRSTQSLKPEATYQPPQRLSPNFNTIEHTYVETASKLRDLAFTTTDQNAKRQKLITEDEIEYEKIKMDTLTEQTQRKLDHDNEIIEEENAGLKARQDAERKKCKADFADKKIER